MNRFNNISNTELSHIIDEWIKSDRDRKLMKRRLIDGITIEKLAEEFGLSVKQAFRIITKNNIFLTQLCNEWVTICP